MNDNKFTGSIYTPAAPGFPLLAVIFKNGEFAAWREVSSSEEGEEVIADAVNGLPTLTDRDARPNEVSVITSSDGKTVFAIARQLDGLFCYFEDRLCFDEDRDEYYWSQSKEPSARLFSTADEAEDEIMERRG